MALHLLRGRSAEEQARRHLEQRGMRLLESNYRCKLGEIDLIMQDGEALVFVEVRYRKSDLFGSALESVTAEKQGRLLATANHYLQRNRASAPCRFDVVGITGQRADARIEWIKDAFCSN
jgi:putative endonuclease